MMMHYVYRHIRSDLNVPFYIGVGTKSSKRSNASYKAEYYRAFIFKRRSDFWDRIFIKCDKKIEVEILYESDSRDVILEKEKEFIALYGRSNLSSGILVNLTDGGDGSLNPSEETREKFRKRSKGNKHNLGKKYTKTPEERAAISKRKKGVKLTEEHKIKLSIARKGKPNYKLRGRKMSPESIAKANLKKIGKPAWNKGVPRTEEEKRKMSLSNMGRATWNKGVPRTPEEKKKISVSKMGKKRTTPIWNKGLSGYRIKRVKPPPIKSEETRKKLSESIKRYWDNKKANQ